MTFHSTNVNRFYFFGFFNDSKIFFWGNFQQVQPWANLLRVFYCHKWLYFKIYVSEGTEPIIFNLLFSQSNFIVRFSNQWTCEKRLLKKYSASSLNKSYKFSAFPCTFLFIWIRHGIWLFKEFCYITENKWMLLFDFVRSHYNLVSGDGREDLETSQSFCLVAMRGNYA